MLLGSGEPLTSFGLLGHIEDSFGLWCAGGEVPVDLMRDG